jgi:gamma-glutamyltranspeptidase
VLAGQDTQTAQGAPRWAIADFGPFSAPGVQVEPGVPAAILRELRRRGHQIEEMVSPQSAWGPVSVIAIDGDRRDTHRDPRVDTTEAVVL